MRPGRVKHRLTSEKSAYLRPLDRPVRSAILAYRLVGIAGRNGRLLRLRPMMHDDPIALVGGVRTAIGRFGGALKDVEAADLGAACIRELIARAGIDAGEVDEVVMGQVAQVGPGRLQRAALRARRGPAAVVDGDERQPPLLLGPAGDRERRAVDPRPARRASSSPAATSR